MTNTTSTPMITIELFYDERDEAYDVYANTAYVGQITNWDDDELRALGFKRSAEWGDEFTAEKI